MVQRVGYVQGQEPRCDGRLVLVLAVAMHVSTPTGPLRVNCEEYRYNINTTDGCNRSKQKQNRGDRTAGCRNEVDANIVKSPQRDGINTRCGDTCLCRTKRRRLHRNIVYEPVLRYVSSPFAPCASVQPLWLSLSRRGRVKT